MIDVIFCYSLSKLQRVFIQKWKKKTYWTVSTDTLSVTAGANPIYFVPNGTIAKRRVRKNKPLLPRCPPEVVHSYWSGYGYNTRFII